MSGVFGVCFLTGETHDVLLESGSESLSGFARNISPLVFLFSEGGGALSGVLGICFLTGEALDVQLESDSASLLGFD